MRRARIPSILVLGAVALTMACGDTERVPATAPNAPSGVLDYDGCLRSETYCNPVQLDSYERSNALNMATTFMMSSNWQCNSIGNTIWNAVSAGTALTYGNPAPPGHGDHMDHGDYHPTGMGTSMDGQMHIDRDFLLDPGLWGHEATHATWHDGAEKCQS